MNAYVSGVVVLAAIAMANAGLVPLGHGGVQLVAHALPAGHGAEGQYIPDINEKLYDDGSYRPELQAIPLANSPYGLTPAGSGLEGAYAPELELVKLAPSPYGLTPAGSGLEGAYVHDINEKLYDDGSYRPELQAIPLAASPYGLTPAGSGLEGAYVHDINEKLYDDGSYRHGLHH